MNGVIPINKPKGFTSFDVIAKLRGITGMKKIGHAGTLDPLATGVLPVFFGKATKICDIMPDSDKSYRAQFKLGISTDTLDVTGNVVSNSDNKVTIEQIEKILPDFQGEIMQTPPMYSAVSVNGKRLYELARQGKDVKRPQRQVRINSLKLLWFDDKAQRGELFVDCSKGTYVRTLISDIGEKLNTGGVLEELVRTRSNGFTIEECVTLEDMQNMKDSGGDFSRVLIPVDRVFREFPEIRLNAAQSRMFLNGVRLDLNRVNYSGKDVLHRVYSSEGSFMALALPDEEKGVLVSAKMLCERT